MEQPALMKAGKDALRLLRNTAQMAGSTAVAEVALRNRFTDGEGARVLGRASAGQWLYLARTAASEINMGIASVRCLLFLLIAGA